MDPEVAARKAAAEASLARTVERIQKTREEAAGANRKMRRRRRALEAQANRHMRTARNLARDAMRYG